MPLNVMAMTAPQMATVFNPLDGHRKAVEVNDPHAFDDGYLLETSYGYQEIDETELGFSVASGYDRRLSRSITSSQTTINVTNTLSEDGHQFTMADFGTKVFLTIEPTGSKKENIMCTGVTSSSWTGCTRGLAFYGTSTSAVAANQETHSAGSQIIMSNVHYVFEEFVDKDTSQTVTGVITYTASPIVPSPTTNTQAANKLYVDGVAQQGGATSSASTVGLVELGTQTEIASTTFNSNRPQVLSTQYSTSSPDVRGVYVPVSENDGYLDQDWLDLTEDWSFSGDVTVTGDTTLASTTLNATTTVDRLPITQTDLTPYDNKQLTPKKYVDDNSNAGLIVNDLTAKSVTGSTAETTVFTGVIPAGTLTGTSSIDLFVYNQVYTKGTGDWTTKIKINGSIVLTEAVITSTATYNDKIKFLINANGSGSVVLSVRESLSESISSQNINAGFTFNPAIENTVTITVQTGNSAGTTYAHTYATMKYSEI